MKNFYFLFLFVMMAGLTFAQTDEGVSIGKGNSPAHSKAILELVSHSKGILIPRLTTAERQQVFSGADQTAKGLLVFDSTEDRFYYWDGGKWNPVGTAGTDAMKTTDYDPAGIKEQLAGLTAAQTLTHKTLTSPVITSPAGLTKADVGLDQVNNTADADKPVSTATQAGLDLKLNKSATLAGDVSGMYNETAIANGVVTSAKIADGTITSADLSSMGAAGGQVMKWTNSGWVPGTDETGGGSAPDNLGNHTATSNLRMGTYLISNDGGNTEGLAFDASGNASFAQNVAITGDVTVNGNLYSPSDGRLKNHIETLGNVLNKLNQVRGVSFSYNDQSRYASGTKIGVVAQELQKVYPEMVTQGADGYLKVDYTQLAAVLIQAVKEQQQQINLLQKQLNGQE